MPRTLLGFDFGRLRIGVAVGNTLTGSARALRIVEAEPLERRWAEIASLIDEWRPDALVVGRPVVHGAPASEAGAAASSSAGQGESDAPAASQARGDEAAAASKVREIAARCERFSRQLAGRFRLPVELVDESGSSLEASAILAAREREERSEPGERRGGGRRTGPPADDAEAAAVILRQYLSRARSSSSSSSSPSSSG